MYSIKMCCRRRERDHEIITTTMDGKKTNYLKIDRLRKKPMTNPLRKEVTAIPCRELLSTISLGISCHPRKRTRKIEKGKKYQIRKRKKTHQIFDIQLFSRLRTVPFFGSVCGASPKK